MSKVKSDNLSKGKEEWTPLTKLNNAFQSASYDSTRMLEGKILTIIDASFTDREQREAMKSLIRNALYDNYFPMTQIIYQFSKKFAGTPIELVDWKYESGKLPTANFFSED